MLSSIFFKKNNHVNLRIQELYSITNSKSSTGNLYPIFLILRCGFSNKVVLFFIFIFFLKTRGVNNLQRVGNSLHYSGVFLNNVIKLFTLTPDYNSYVEQYKGYSLNSDAVVINKKLLITPKYNSSSMNKYISDKGFNSIYFQFLRKNKVFNKGRYSRCRQNYRTGVYLCMHLSVICIFGLYF